MKKTFTVPEAPGSKRTSVAHIYTHAVIGQFDHDKALKSVDKIYQIDMNNFDYWYKNSLMKAGDLVYVTGVLSPWSYPMEQIRIDEGKARVAEFGTRHKYADAERLVRIARVEAYRAKVGDKFLVMCWSGSYDLAAKRFNEFPYMKNLRVVECVEVVKK